MKDLQGAFVEVIRTFFIPVLSSTSVGKEENITGYNSPDYCRAKVLYKLNIFVA